RQLRQGMGDVGRNWWLAVRCSTIGVYIGMIPGIGGAVVDWIAYGHALQSTKNPETYGNGDIRGVIAPEAANNAVRGGSMIPTVAFGVPGSAMNALLLGALLIQGLQPGKPMLTTDLPITFAMIWNIALANIIAAALLMVLANQIAKLSFVSAHLIVPGVILFVFMGAWLSLAEIGDWITLMVFGLLGYVMKLGGWPRPPVILAFILGSLMENSFLLSWKIHEGLGWIDRPIVVVILVLFVATLIFSVRRNRRRDTAAEGGETSSRSAPQDLGDEPAWPLMSLIIGAVFLATFAAAILPLPQWPVLVFAFPLLAIVPGILLTAGAVTQDVFKAPALTAMWGEIRAEPEFRRGVQFLGYCLAMIALAVLVGQKIALIALIATYLIRWGGYGWRIVAPYVAATAVILIGFYDRVVHIFWLKPALAEPLRAAMPEWFPAWLIL
ncbi:MAG: tripartite tricarboxylate transporter permease, partial [Pseudomonadota bacterium]